jgi:hypothetical protein
LHKVESAPRVGLDLLIQPCAAIATKGCRGDNTRGMLEVVDLWLACGDAEFARPNGVVHGKDGAGKALAITAVAEHLVEEASEVMVKERRGVAAPCLRCRLAFELVGDFLTEAAALDSGLTIRHLGLLRGF